MEAEERWSRREKRRTRLRRQTQSIEFFFEILIDFSLFRSLALPLLISTPTLSPEPR